MALFELLKDGPKLTWYGRAVGVAEYARGGVDLLDQIVRVQGAAPICWGDAPTLRRRHCCG